METEYRSRFLTFMFSTVVFIVLPFVFQRLALEIVSLLFCFFRRRPPAAKTE